MPPPPKYRAQPWLQSPLRTPVGEIELAGLLLNVPGINPADMRILRRFTLVLMVEGRGYYRDGRGTSYELVPGDVVLVFPEIAHAYGPVRGGEWTQIYFVFDGPQFQLWRAQGLLDPARPVLRLGSPDYWRRRLQDVVKGEPLHTAGAPLRAMGRFLQVVTEMIATDAENVRQAGRDAWLEKSLRLLGERGSGGWATPQDAATQVGLNYENFRKRFAELTGESPGRYQKRRRLEWACAAIYHGESSLKEIADSLGFCDVFHFSKAFKQEIGFTPSDYRRRVRGR
ncbi:AraC family transcriptional regulator [Oleiharenicola lentus]|uniref:AraC family transcriptional regulator n=1 Tax=Oleiharenicola lentus TaxID=2508720 RepID=A0A4Q1CAY2_9BACT|nr:AraC family transcriptional regulator [Oleiharenicola lentus]RXK56214.1 AraC family transcriptional regulator [Oleiharenicola lentus]